MCQPPTQVASRRCFAHGPGKVVTIGRGRLSTPRDDGFAMSPDWVPHSRCWMAWPCREAPWGGGLEAARRAYADVAQAIVRFEPVTMIARPELVAMASLYCGPGITILPLEHDDSWVRDTGPSFLGDATGQLAGVQWVFNGWGEVYPDHQQDRQMAQRILEHVGARRYSSALVLEGGSVHVDGEGTCLAATGAVLDQRRNPGLGREEAEAVLKRELGCTVVIWLPSGLVDDETGGQVENVACFARPGLVLALATDDKADANFSGLAENLDVLRAATDAQTRTLEVVTVPQPKARARHDGRRLTLSHLSCYVANGAVIVPRFGDASDAAASKILAAAWPGREIVPIDALEIVAGGGGIHGITLGQPAG
jgi:agmatine deiminase